jgi:hypothetical protein
MNGYRSHHLLCRPVVIPDAKEKQSGVQAAMNEKPEDLQHRGTEETEENEIQKLF